MSNILNYDGVCETRHNTHGQEKKGVPSAGIEPLPHVKLYSDIVLTFSLPTTRHIGRAHKLLGDRVFFFKILAPTVVAMTEALVRISVDTHFKIENCDFCVVKSHTLMSTH